MATLKDIKNGVRVRNKMSGLIREVKMLPNGMTLREALETEYLDLSRHVLYETVIDNLPLYTTRGLRGLSPENLKANTVSSPLILKWDGAEYKVNKPLDQSGEYVDKKIADTMLDALKIAQHVVSHLGINDFRLNRLSIAISEAQ